MATEINQERFTRDPESGASYVKYLDAQVAYTQQIEDKAGTFIADYDATGRVIGVEFLGKRAKETSYYRAVAQQKSKGPRALSMPPKRLAG
jgi:uncharacterized protein YuzE